MAPARELAIQIHAEAKKLCKPMGITSTCVYGGASVSFNPHTRQTNAVQSTEV